MTVVSIGLDVALFALLVFVSFMWVRLVFDWVRVLRPSWRPHGGGLILAEASYAVTDPPIRLVRRVVPPVRVGGAQLEFSWSIVMLLCLIIIWVIGVV